MGLAKNAEAFLGNGCWAPLGRMLESAGRHDCLGRMGAGIIAQCHTRLRRGRNGLLCSTLEPQRTLLSYRDFQNDLAIMQGLSKRPCHHTGTAKMTLPSYRDCQKESLQLTPRTPILLPLHASTPTISSLHLPTMGFRFGLGLGYFVSLTTDPRT